MPENFYKPQNKQDSGIQPVVEKKGQGEGKIEKEPAAEREIVVHTMPKRFLTTHPGAQKVKSTGLLVLAGGTVFLIIALVFAYFYLLEPKQKLPIGGAKSPVSDQTKVESEKEIDEQTAEKTDEKKAVEDVDEVKADKTPGPGVDTKITTTTVEIKPGPATSTKKIINAQEATSTPKIFKTAIDSDNDGLADMEENLFGCRLDSQDSDGDGYEDLSEVLKLYNPAGSGKIMANDNIEKYINGQYGYSVYYPYVWPVNELGGDDSIIFKLSNNQFIQIIVQPNTKKQTIQNWYKEQQGVEMIKSGQIVYKKGWQAVKNEDGLTVYLTKTGGDHIIIMSYNPGASDTLYYKNIFKMMVESLEMEG